MDLYVKNVTEGLYTTTERGQNATCAARSAQSTTAPPGSFLDEESTETMYLELGAVEGDKEPRSPNDGSMVFVRACDGDCLDENLESLTGVRG